MKPNNRRNRWIVGSAIGAAAIAVAIDHTRHRLPPATPAPATQPSDEEPEVFVIIEEEGVVPCGLDVSPCALDDSPCSMDVAPCSLDES